MNSLLFASPSFYYRGLLIAGNRRQPSTSSEVHAHSSAAYTGPGTPRSIRSLPHIEQLLGEEKVPFQMHGVHDSENYIRLEHNRLSDPFFVAERRYSINSWGIVDLKVAEPPPGQLDRCPGVSL